MVVVQIKDGDGLLSESFLGAISVIEQGGIAPVGTDNHGGGETIGVGDPTREGRLNILLAG